MEQNGTNSIYTGKKQKAAEMLASPEFSGSITELIEAVGVPRTTFYRWMEDDKYISFINSLIERYTDSELGPVWKSLVAQCKKGNVQAIKLFFELKGKYTANIKIESPFAALSADELRKLADG